MQNVDHENASVTVPAGATVPSSVSAAVSAGASVAPAMNINGASTTTSVPSRRSACAAVSARSRRTSARGLIGRDRPPRDGQRAEHRPEAPGAEQRAGPRLVPRGLGDRGDADLDRPERDAEQDERQHHGPDGRRAERTGDAAAALAAAPRANDRLRDVERRCR